MGIGMNVSANTTATAAATSHARSGRGGDSGTGNGRQAPRATTNPAHTHQLCDHHPSTTITAPAAAAERLLLTPHIAGVTRQASTFLFQVACDNVKRVVADGQPPLNRVY